MESVRILLENIIDYAGLFPPAALDMPTVVRNYARYKEGPHAWMLGRFIVQTGRLEEFERELCADGFRLSVLAGADLNLDTERIADFNRRSPRGARIESVESKEVLPPFAGLETYLETSPENVHPPARAKIRTSDLTPEDVAGLLADFKKRNLPFKATAGLHHALRGMCGAALGFLNVFLAAAWTDSAVEVLRETSPFAFDEHGVTWRSHRLTNQQLREARRFAISFGSCSFEEPIEDLQRLRLI